MVESVQIVILFFSYTKIKERCFYYDAKQDAYLQ